MKTNLSPILALLAVLTLVGCHRGAQNSFTADGTISGAEGQVLYLEATSADEPAILDSVTLGKDGRFSFQSEACSYPLFFRLSRRLFDPSECDSRWEAPLCLLSLHQG